MNKVTLTKGIHKLQFKRPYKSFKLLYGNDVWIYRQLPEKCDSVNAYCLFDGDYYSPNSFDVVDSQPLKDEKNTIELYEKERERERPIIIRHVPGLADTPARIFTNRNPALIEVGDRFYTYPAPVRMFILLHEYGHLFYKSEHKTDCYALKKYLEMGLPPSMAFFALANVLHDSPQSTFRIKKIFQELKENGYVNSN